MRRSALFMLAASAALLGPSATTGCKSDAAAANARPLGADVPITGNIKVDHLDGPVDVVRDSFGMIHIYATSMTDAVRVQAYQVARDRTVQLELIRRFSEGTIAEVYGGINADAIDNDISQRTIGLLRTGQKIYAGLAADSEEKKWLDAFADGVSQFYARVQSGDEELPKSMVGLSAQYLTPWTGADSLAIARYQSQNLSFDADSDVSRQEFLDAAKKAFDPASADAKLKARAGLFHDLLRFQPLDPTTTVTAFSDDATHTQAWQLGANKHKFGPGEVRAMHVDPGLIHATDAWRKAQAEGERIFGDLPTRGSNNWVVAPSKSTTGHPLVNNDPHLSLSAPAVFWMVHVSVKAPPGKDATKNGSLPASPSPASRASSWASTSTWPGGPPPPDGT